MKSLQESLFDTDLVTKELPGFGSYFEFTVFNFRDNNVYYTSPTPYNSIFSHFKLADLKKKYKPTDISNARFGPLWASFKYNEISAYVKPLEYIVSLINDVEIPDPDTFSKSYEFIDKLVSLLQEKIKPYMKDGKIRFNAYGSYGIGDRIVIGIEEVGFRRRDDNYTMNLLFERR